MIADVCRLYVEDGHIVADVTYGKGAFWREADSSRFKLLKSDIKTVAESPFDLTELPYEPCSIDHIVLDPPYMHNAGTPMVDGRYQNSTTTGGEYHADIMSRLYAGGIVEARRVLKNRGKLWVKCQDEVQSGKQQWSHIEIYLIATSLGFYAKDLFVLNATSTTPVQVKKQQHARRNHSYLWILEKRI